MVLAAKTIEDLTKAMSSIDQKVEDLVKKQKDSDNETIAAIFRGASHPIVGRMSDEERALKFFGCSHPAQLLQVNTSLPKYRRVPDEIKQTVVDLKQAVNTARWISQQFHGEKLDKIGASADLDRVAR